MIWILMTVLMVVSYVACNMVMGLKEYRYVTIPLWCVVFVIISMIRNCTAIHGIAGTDTQWVVFAIVAVLLQLVMAWNFPEKRLENRKEQIYHTFILPIALEVVFGGVLLPEIFVFNHPVLLYWIDISIIHINLAVLIVTLLQFLLRLFDSRTLERSSLTYALEIATILFHTLIIVTTASIIIPVVLRLVYGFINFRIQRQRR